MPLGPTVGTLDWTFYAYAMYQNKYTIFLIEAESLW